ncbi:MAG: hypothetical protein Q8S73_12630 [Deltaproteobacteria bacterium]|nr:hypothetical protein [Myxococcales bacterium]MDP3214945.1 hypothetical protein [Deltaproteobacteria bacterium]
MDPWAVLRRLRALPLVDATTRDEDINGGDAVETLCEVRQLLDTALTHAPADGGRRLLSTEERWARTCGECQRAAAALDNRGRCEECAEHLDRGE